MICWALVLSLPAMAVPAWATAPRSLSAIPPGVWAAFLYLSLVSQLFAFFLWNAGLAIGGIARVSQTQLFQPFVTIAASGFLLGEAIAPRTIVFAILVTGLVVVGRGMPVLSGNRLDAGEQAISRRPGAKALD